ncbi:ferredoxin [Tomitella biformata]|uniref:ferredoxin n=1 Tax=Tomitella biformata TaxID=630403 RepID=UPI000467DE99|nr:ferredoxin [Tomitella biformata]
MKIHVDLELCQGHAMCEMEAPDVFHVPRHGKVQLRTEHPTPEQLADVERAVAYCPTQALRLENLPSETNPAPGGKP